MNSELENGRKRKEIIECRIMHQGLFRILCTVKRGREEREERSILVKNRVLELALRTQYQGGKVNKTVVRRTR